MKKKLLFINFCSLLFVSNFIFADDVDASLTRRSLLGDESIEDTSTTVKTFASTFTKAEREKYQNLYLFLLAYGCSAEVEDHLANPKNSRYVQGGIQRVESRDGTVYYVKPDIDRVVYAKAIERYLSEKSIHSIAVPQKCVSSEGKTVASAVDVSHSVTENPRVDNSGKAMSRNHLIDYEDFKHRFYYGDGHGGNLKVNKMGKLVIIDTEERSFHSKEGNSITVKTGEGCFSRTQTLCSKVITDEYKRFMNERGYKKSFYLSIPIPLGNR